jgi:Domain of unknown function (DUF5615)
VRILLDENFPLALHRALREANHQSEHIIELGLQGISDARILERLAREELLFLTQDEDFLGVRTELKAVVMVSRVPQALPTRARVTIWLRAIEAYCRDKPVERMFEVDAQGRLLPWRHLRL